MGTEPDTWVVGDKYVVEKKKEWVYEWINVILPQPQVSYKTELALSCIYFLSG